MNHDFDTYVKEHLQEILCEAEKNHALSLLTKVRHNHTNHTPLSARRQFDIPEVQLQDCAISPGLSHSRL